MPVLTLKTHKIINQILQKKIILSVLHALTACHSVAPREKISSISILKTSIYLLNTFLFLLFYFHTIYWSWFPENTNADNICKVIYILNNAIWSMLYKTWLVNNFIKFSLSKIFLSQSKLNW